MARIHVAAILIALGLLPRVAVADGIFVESAEPGSSVHVDSLFVVPDTGTVDDVIVGRLLLRGRLQLLRSLAIDASGAFSWAAARDEDDGFAMGNPSAGVVWNPWPDDRDQLALSFRVYFPLLRLDELNSDLAADVLAGMAHPYELGIYVPEAWTLRTSLRYHWLFDTTAIDLDAGLDGLIPPDDALVKFELLMHAGADVFFNAGSGVSPFLEGVWVQEVASSTRDVDGLSVDSDNMCGFFFGGGVRLGAKGLFGDVYLVLPLSDDVRDPNDLLMGVRLGARL